MKPTGKYMVCTICTTYNHATYIKDTMRGFVLQETTFPYVSVIIDDNSIDDTKGAINRFLDDEFDFSDGSVACRELTDFGEFRFARHRWNANCFFAVFFLKENHYRLGKSKGRYYGEWLRLSRYVALCEGDDYWTDPLKLQRQVVFLEEHLDYSMCFHKVSVICEENEKWIFANTRAGDYSAREIYDDWVVPTCSVVFRFSTIPSLTHPNVIFSDIYLFLQLAEIGHLYCLDFIGAVYRRHDNSASKGYSVNTCIRLYNQYLFFEKRFPDLKDISRRKQESQGLRQIIYAPYFPGIWKYRFLYMFRHPKLFFSPFFTNTILSYTPLRFFKRWKRKKS